MAYAMPWEGAGAADGLFSFVDDGSDTDNLNVFARLKQSSALPLVLVLLLLLVLALLSCAAKTVAGNSVACLAKVKELERELSGRRLWPRWL